MHKVAIVLLTPWLLQASPQPSALGLDQLAWMAGSWGSGPAGVETEEQTSKDKAVFENPEHDFPQRILYWRDGANLCARIEGTQKGKPAGQEWCWKPLR